MLVITLFRENPFTLNRKLSILHLEGEGRKCRRVEIYFRTNRLRRNYEESARARRAWGPEAGQRYVTRINELRRITNFHSVYNIRSMRLHPLTGDMAGKLSIYLTGAWRLIVTKGDTEESLIVEEVSNHYGD